MFKSSNGSVIIVLASAVFLTACGGGYSSSNSGYGSGSGGGNLVGFSVYAQSTPSIIVTGKVDVRASGYYGSNSSYKDLTHSATWSTSDDAVATVFQGNVIGVGVGSAKITATSGAETGSITVVVGLTPTMAVSADSPDSLSLAHPQRQFFANATYTDGSHLDLTSFVIWTSSPLGVVKFDDPYGLFPGMATLISTGTTTITATHRPGEEGSLNVTVDP